jgi:hypothetical protein
MFYRKDEILFNDVRFKVAFFLLVMVVATMIANFEAA